MDVCQRALARYFVDILAEMDNKWRVVLKFTAGRQRTCGSLRVVRATGDDTGAVVLTLAAEGKGGALTGVQDNG